MDKRDDDEVLFRIFIDLNEYKKSPICKLCHRDFNKCNPKCDTFYYLNKFEKEKKKKKK